ncbi:MAG: hypothetical protein ABWZ82_06665 [Candidatus Limnocylindrales bacterium]
MSTASQVESFCESCGTRYAFEPRRSAKRHLVKVGRLVGILADEPDVDDSALVISKDPFHGAFHFCLECRRFTCPTCWDASAGFCRSCAAVLAGTDTAEPEYTLDADTQALLRAAFEDLARLGSGTGWTDMAPPPEARPEPVARSTDVGDAPADDLTLIIEAGTAAMVAREAQAAREAAEREQARLEQERREQAEAERMAAEQAEAQRVAWEEYERQRQQYEADLAAWEAAEAQRLAGEEAQRVADEEARRWAAERAEADRLAAEHAEAERMAAEAEARRLESERAEAAVIAAQRAEAERLALVAARLVEQRLGSERLAAEAEAQQRAAEQQRLEAERAEAPEEVWDTLAGALGPDVAAEEPAHPPAPVRPQSPPVPHVPPPPMPHGAWHSDAPGPAMPGWAPPPPQPGFRPPAPGWNGGHAAQAHGQAANAQLRSGIRPCPRCDLALSANARFCRRCGLPQG